MPVICCRKKSVVPMVICFRLAGASSSATDASFSPLSSPAVARGGIRRAPQRGLRGLRLGDFARGAATPGSPARRT